MSCAENKPKWEKEEEEREEEGEKGEGKEGEEDVWEGEERWKD